MDILKCKCGSNSVDISEKRLRGKRYYFVKCISCKEGSGWHEGKKNATDAWRREVDGRCEPVKGITVEPGVHEPLATEPQTDFFTAVAKEVEYSTVRHPWHNLRPGQIYDALKGENLELAEAMLTEDYRQIMTEATHVAGMCKRIYEQAREALRRKRVAG